jgi:nucleotide-binding universal stress UspA family protein
MFNRILVPTDGSPLSEKAVDTAVEFARANRSEIVALSVAEPYIFPLMAEGSGQIPVDTEAYEERVLALAQQYVGHVAKLAQAGNVVCKTTVAVSTLPYEEIVQAAAKYGCDVIFMASHGRKGLNRLFLGSETQKVLAHSTIPVLVLR